MTPILKKKSFTGFLSVTVQFIKFFHWSTKLSMEQCLAASVTYLIIAPLNGHYGQSSFQHLLATPKARLKTCGERTFAVAGPGLWNSIPLELRSGSSIDSFKRHFKTYLFKQASNSFQFHQMVNMFNYLRIFSNLFILVYRYRNFFLFSLFLLAFL